MGRLKREALILLLLPATLWAGTVEVRKEGDALHLTAHAASLGEVVNALAATKGYEVKSEDSTLLARTITADERGSLEEIAGRVVRPASIVLRRQGEAGTLWILPAGKEDSAYLKSGKGVDPIIAGGGLGQGPGSVPGQGQRKPGVLRKQMTEEEWKAWRKAERERRRAESGQTK